MVQKVIRLKNTPSPKAPAPVPKCLVCSVEEKVKLWTLDSGRRASAMYLCPEHAAPLEVLLDQAGFLPPSQQTPMRDERKIPSPPRPPRQRNMKPLAWEPPAEGQ
jgi:hypothetical protein